MAIEYFKSSKIISKDHILIIRTIDLQNKSQEIIRTNKRVKGSLEPKRDTTYEILEDKRSKIALKTSNLSWKNTVEDLSIFLNSSHLAPPKDISAQQMANSVERAGEKQNISNPLFKENRSLNLTSWLYKAFDPKKSGDFRISDEFKTAEDYIWLNDE